MTVRDITDDELENFLADLGITDTLKPEIGQIVSPPPLPDNLVFESRPTPRRSIWWLVLGFTATFLLGLLIGIFLPLQNPSNVKLQEIQKQIDSLSSKISSYEEVTLPKFELIEPLTTTEPFDKAA